MGIPNHDEVKGKVDEVVGTLKEKVDHEIGDKEMERQGATERDAADVRQQIGKVKREIGEAIEDLGEFVRK